MAGVSSTSSSARLSPVPPTQVYGVAGGVCEAGEGAGFGEAILHVAPSHETIKSYLFQAQGWTLDNISDLSPVVKATLQFALKRAPVGAGATSQADPEASLQEGAESKVTFFADIRSNRSAAISYCATLDQNTLFMPEPVMMTSVYKNRPQTSDVRVHENWVLDVLLRVVGTEVTAISSKELDLTRDGINLHFTAGIDHTSEPEVLTPTTEEVAESHQKLISLLRAKTSEQKAQRYDAICDLTLACSKGKSFPPITNTDLLGSWDLIAIDGTKPKDLVSYQWVGEEEGLLGLKCSIAKGKLRLTASGDIATSEGGSSFATYSDSYFEIRQSHRHRSNEGDWYKINHFLFKPSATLDGCEDDREWKVVSFSEEHLLFSDPYFNTMLLTRKEESGATGGADRSRFSTLRKSFKKPFFKE